MGADEPQDLPCCAALALIAIGVPCRAGCGRRERRRRVLGVRARGPGGRGFERQPARELQLGAYGVGTWLSFMAGASNSPADRADVSADTLGAAVDHRFGSVGVTFEVERWGDPDALETQDLRASVYVARERFRIGIAYEHRDIDIPFTLTGPLGGTLSRTAEVRPTVRVRYERAAGRALAALLRRDASTTTSATWPSLPRIAQLNLAEHLDAHACEQLHRSLTDGRLRARGRADSAESHLQRATNRPLTARFSRRSNAGVLFPSRGASISR